MTAANKISVMEGSLSDFHLVEILQVLSVSRQYTRIELFSSDRTTVGSLFMKSGKVVQASTGTLNGRDAFLALVRRQASFFSVFRIQTPALIPEPIDALAPLLLDAFESDEEPEELTLDITPVPRAARGARQAVPPQRTVQWPPAYSAPTPPHRVHSAPAAAVPLRTRKAATLGSGNVPRAASSPEDQSPRPRANPSGVMPAVGAPGGSCVIAVASPKGGAGKTTMALNLALSLARQERAVILVDGDVNGDVLSSIDGRGSARTGVFDVLAGHAAPADALRKTVVPNLQIVPAIGLSLPKPEMLITDCWEEWHQLLGDLSRRAEIVLVDTPAGMFGVTHQILGNCTHVLGVLQAEVLAQRSFTMFAESLETLEENRRPEVLGVFLNMLQIGHNASISVLEKACEKLPRSWLFETSIPRHPAFLDATLAGVPLHLCDPKQPPSVSWLFDALATEVVDRLELAPRETKARERRFLV